MQNEPSSSMCIESGKYNATKVEIDKHIIFCTMEKQSSFEQCGKAFSETYFFGSIQELLLGQSHTCQYREKTIARSPDLKKHAQKAHNIIKRNGS